MNKGWIAAALLLCSMLCFGQEKSFVAIHGFDKMSCEDWLGSDGNADVRAQYIAWIRGVVTGYNYANPDNQVQSGRMPTDFGLTIFVDNYCHSKRATSVAGAAFALIADRRGSGVATVVEEKHDARPGTDDDMPGFHDWLARQSADIKSLGPDLQRSIYKKEAALHQQ